MDEHVVDVAPAQIIRWVRTEMRMNPDAFDISASRDFVAAEIGSFEDAGISEDTDVASVTAVGLLEIAPAMPPKGWTLRLRARDPLDEHLPEDHSATDDPEAIDLDTFEALFVDPKRASIDVALLAETPEAKAQFDRVFADLLRDRHSE